MARSPSALGTSGVIESARWMLGGLGVQFVVGMYTNLFVSMPPRSVGGMMVHMGFGVRMPPIFAVHMWLGVALAVGATVVLGIGWHTARRATALAWTAILLAGFGGLMFFMGGQRNSDSFIMALGWLIAVGAYGAIGRSIDFRM